MDTRARPALEPVVALVMDDGRQPDVGALDPVIAAAYATISGPPGSPRDWDGFMGLFAPGARLITVNTTAESTSFEWMSAADYRASRNDFLVEHGYTETETARQTSVRGNLAHVFSSFEGATSDDAMRTLGWNSIQLAWADGRWAIISLLWEATAFTRRL